MTPVQIKNICYLVILPAILLSCKKVSTNQNEENPFRITRIQPVKLIKKGAGHYFFDFGKAGFGTVVIHSESEDLHNLEIHLGEKLGSADSIDRDPGGTIRYQRVAVKKIHRGKEYTVELAPDKRNTNELAVELPDTFDVIMPFRYCEIKGLNVPLDEITIHQKVYHYRFNDSASYFISSDTILNQVWDLCKYTIKATSFSGYYIDGDRERIVYEADALINQLGHYCVDAEYSMARRTNEYVLNKPTWPVEWILTTVPMFYYDFLYTGNIEPIRRNYEKLKHKTLMALERKDGLISSESEKLTGEIMANIGFRDTTQRIRPLVDWPPAQNDSTWEVGTKEGERDGYDMSVNINTVVNAYYYHNMVLMAEIAGHLGLEDDAEFYAEKAVQVKQSMNEILLDKEKHIYVDGENSDHSSLHANLFPLAFGIVPEEYVDHVIDFIKTRGMACSVYGAQFLLEGLYKHHEEEYAHELMTATHDRSWWNMIRVGSTMALEAWDMKYKSNLDWNHPWGAAPANIIPRYMWGITPIKPGFELLQIKPQLSQLSESRIKVPTPKGPVLASYSIFGDGVIKYKIELPINMIAEFIVVNPKYKQIRLNGEIIIAQKGRLILEKQINIIEVIN